MGGSSNKKSSISIPELPKFEPTTTRYGGEVIGRVYRDPDRGLINEYLPDSAEIERKRYSDARIRDLLPQLISSGPEAQKQADEAAKAFSDSATADFNRQYDPMLRSLREDIGSRFGTLKASPYFDRLQELEQNVRTPALVEIARQATLNKQGVLDAEQNRKLKELQGLGYIFGNDETQFMNNLQNPLQAGQTYQNFSLNRYGNDLQRYNTQVQQRANDTNSVLRFLGSVF